VRSESKPGIVVPNKVAFSMGEDGDSATDWMVHLSIAGAELSFGSSPGGGPTHYSWIAARPSRGLALTCHAIGVVLRRLSLLTPSPEVEGLRRRADDYLHEAKGWGDAMPTVQERDGLMKRVLGLHVEVARLERAVACT